MDRWRQLVQYGPAPMRATTVAWTCPVCGGRSSQPAFRRSSTVTDVGSSDLTPAADTFGVTIDTVVRCVDCGHGSLASRPSSEVLDHAYGSVVDDDTVEEEQAQVATSLRDLAEVGRLTGETRGRLLDIGCWTGSLLVAAGELGWDAEGVDPSSWAVERATQRGVRACEASIDGIEQRGPYQVVTCCDVLEHLVDPGAALERIHALLEPGGVLFATVPDGGSLVARMLGRRWWSVLPMHVQYFTKTSLESLLRRRGFEVLVTHSHPKIFSRRYYAHRFGAFVPIIGPLLASAVDRSRTSEQPVAPDFRDRIAIIARATEER